MFIVIENGKILKDKIKLDTVYDKAIIGNRLYTDFCVDKNGGLPIMKMTRRSDQFNISIDILYKIYKEVYIKKKSVGITIGKHTAEIMDIIKNILGGYLGPLCIENITFGEDGEIYNGYSKIKAFTHNGIWYESDDGDVIAENFVILRNGSIMRRIEHKKSFIVDEINIDPVNDVERVMLETLKKFHQYVIN